VSAKAQADGVLVMFAPTSTATQSKNRAPRGMWFNGLPTVFSMLAARLQGNGGIIVVRYRYSINPTDNAW